MSTSKLTALFIAAAGLLVPAAASAQIRSEPVDPPPSELPPPQDDDDPIPPAARPEGPNAGITKQAGVGGTQAYGRAGVLELGGSLGFTAAEDFAQFNATPTIGWFFADNLQLSALLGVTYSSMTSTVGTEEVDSSSTLLSFVIEPSYHLPFSDTVFGFLGVGAGFGMISNSVGDVDSDDTGFLISPRLGMNFLVGRSGILSPYLHVDYTTGEILQVPGGNAVAVNVAYGGNIGYTVMW